jgi:hypothetical protein
MLLRCLTHHKKVESPFSALSTHNPSHLAQLVLDVITELDLSLTRLASHLICRAEVEFSTPCLGRASPVHLPYSIQFMKPHSTPPRLPSEAPSASDII